MNKVKNIWLLLFAFIASNTCFSQKTVNIKFVFKCINSNEAQNYEATLTLSLDDEPKRKSSYKSQLSENNIDIDINNDGEMHSLYALLLIKKDDKPIAKVVNNGFSFNYDYSEKKVWDKDETIYLIFDIGNKKVIVSRTEGVIKKNTNTESPMSIGVVFNKNSSLAAFVIKGSPADKVGILKGDEFISINGSKIDNNDPVTAIKAVGNEVRVEIRRNGSVKIITISKAAFSSFTDKCFSGNCENGNGTYIYNSGKTYTGQFKNKFPDGQGTMLYTSGGMYVGGFKMNNFYGQGKYTNSDGSSFIGYFDTIPINGKGTLFYSSEEKFVGELKNKLKENVGVYTYKSGDRYEGSFKKNLRIGKGVYFFADGKKYDGNWDNDKLNGYGVFTWPDGSKYEGNYVDNKKNGKGIETLSTGEKFEGSWAAGKKEGDFVHYIKRADGSYSKIKEVYKEDKKIDIVIEQGNPTQAVPKEKPFVLQKFELPAGLTFGMSIDKAKALLKQNGYKEIEDLFEDEKDVDNLHRYFECKEVEYMGVKGKLKPHFYYNTLSSVEFTKWDKFDYKKVLNDLRKKYGNEYEGEEPNEDNEFTYTFWNDKIRIKYEGQTNTSDGYDKYTILISYYELRANTIFKNEIEPHKSKFPLGLYLGMDITDAFKVMLTNSGVLNREDMPGDLKGVLLDSEADFFFNKVLFKGTKHTVNLQFSYGKLTAIDYSSMTGEKFDENKILDELKKIWGDKPEPKKYSATSILYTWKAKEMYVEFLYEKYKVDVSRDYYKVSYGCGNYRELLTDEEYLQDPRKLENASPLEEVGVK